MKIFKTRLKQIIREEIKNLEEYSPYKTGARPDKPHKKPGETKDDGKYADPKRARPKRRYEEQEELMEDEEEDVLEESDSGSLSNIYKLCPPNTKCDPESQKTNWWGSRGNLNEELTRQDKTDVKKMVKDELEKLLKKKEMKDQISELTKKILKKLYKDLSLEHPYIIDRIKI